MIESIEKFLQPVKDFIFENNRNPLFWSVIIIVALIIFGIVYHALHKEK